MDFERTLETQRLRLLRVIAGLAVLLGVLSLGPVSRCFSDRVRAFVGSVLSCAETAARYLVIAQAHKMAVHSGFNGDRRLISEALDRAFVAGDADVSIPEYWRRLKALRSVLMDLPRHALRLLRRLEKQGRHENHTDGLSPRLDASVSTSLCDWRLSGNRIERPPIAA